jgi:hypothetical protein
MWLGLSAILIAFGYAIIKFLTSLHLRRLRDLHTRLLHEVKRERQRLQAVEGKLQVQHSQRGAVEQTLANARRFKDDLFSRLRLSLPSGLTAELRQCINRHPIPEPEGVRTAQELHLADKVTEALTSLSILVVEFNTAESDSAHTVLAGDLVQRLTELDARFTGPAIRNGEPEDSPQILTTAFDEPQAALELMMQLGASHGQQAHILRAVLVAGITVTEFDQEHVNRLFARTLHSTRPMVEEAAPGTLVCNERAYELLGKRPGLEASEGLDSLSILALGTTETSADEFTDPDTGSVSGTDTDAKDGVA